MQRHLSCEARRRLLSRPLREHAPTRVSTRAPPRPRPTQAQAHWPMLTCSVSGGGLHTCGYILVMSVWKMLDDLGVCKKGYWSVISFSRLRPGVDFRVVVSLEPLLPPGQARGSRGKDSLWEHLPVLEEC